MVFPISSGNNVGHSLCRSTGSGFVLKTPFLLKDGNAGTELHHRIAGVRRDLKRSSSSSPPLKAGSLQQVTQVGIQMGLKYLQRRNRPSHHLSRQPVQCSVTLTVFVWNSLCSSFCLLPLVLLLQWDAMTLAENTEQEKKKKKAYSGLMLCINTSRMAFSSMALTTSGVRAASFSAPLYKTY